MKITILAVGSEAQYQPTFDTAYQYLKKETAALSAELSYAICRPDAAELFAALRNAMGQSEAVVLLLSPEPAAVSTALRVVCGGLERTAHDALPICWKPAPPAWALPWGMSSWQISPPVPLGPPSCPMRRAWCRAMLSPRAGSC